MSLAASTQSRVSAGPNSKLTKGCSSDLAKHSNINQAKANSTNPNLSELENPTSKASTPLLVPKQGIPPAHLRHHKSNSLSSISGNKTTSVSGMNKGLTRESLQDGKNDRSALPEPPKQWSRLHYPPPSGLGSNSYRASKTSAKTPTNFVSRIPVTVPKLPTSKTGSIGVKRLLNSNASREKDPQLKSSTSTQNSPSSNNNDLDSKSSQKLNPVTKKTSGTRSGITKSTISGRVLPPSKIPPPTPHKPLRPILSKGSLVSTASPQLNTKSAVNSISRPKVTAKSILPTESSTTVKGVSSSQLRTLSKPILKSVPATAMQKSVSSTTTTGVKRPLTKALIPPTATSLLKSSSASLKTKNLADSNTTISSTRSSQLKSKSAAVTQLKNISTASGLKAASSHGISKVSSMHRSSLLTTRASKATLKSASNSEIDLSSKKTSVTKGALRLPASLQSRPEGIKKSTSSYQSSPMVTHKDKIISPARGKLIQKSRSIAAGTGEDGVSMLSSASRQFATGSVASERASSSLSVPSSYCAEPMTPYSILRAFRLQLTPYERTEVLSYPHIYYFGSKAKKIITKADDDAEYHNPSGHYVYPLHDHLAYRYEIVKPLGKGSFGQVIKAFDHKTGREVAIKIIRNTDKLHRQALTEISLLESLTRWDRDGSSNVIHIIEQFSFRDHLCIVTELYGLNLYELIKLHKFSGFKQPLVSAYAYQIVKCLKLLSTRGIVHCDLKPENILIATPDNAKIKVIDFGSACYSTQQFYTYIQSRFYRSPEVILELPYGPPIDMWSLGCILVELSCGQPIFPGENEPEQLGLIMEVLGAPLPTFVNKSKRRFSFFDAMGNPRPNLSRRKRLVPGSRPLNKILKSHDEHFLDFVTRCLQIDPDRRLTPDQALAHSFLAPFQQLHSPTSFRNVKMKSISSDELGPMAPVVQALNNHSGSDNSYVYEPSESEYGLKH